MNSIHAQRLLNVARACRETSAPQGFSMQRYGNGPAGSIHRDCGTPACAMGNYAFRTDLQDVFTLDLDNAFYPLRAKDHGAHYDSLITLNHFGISTEEAEALFGPAGCNNAQTHEAAATYIEAFVAERYQPEPMPVTVREIFNVETTQEKIDATV